MKPLFKEILRAIRKEWFLLVILGVIGLIVFLFEAIKV